MNPEQFFYQFQLIDKNELFEMRIRSLEWMLGCYEAGTIRRNTIINLIPLETLQELLKDMEIEERYEDCVIIKDVIDIIYLQINSNKKEK